MKNRNVVLLNFSAQAIFRNNMKVPVSEANTAVVTVNAMLYGIANAKGRQMERFYHSCYPCVNRQGCIMALAGYVFAC